MSTPAYYRIWVLFPGGREEDAGEDPVEVDEADLPLRWLMGSAYRLLDATFGNAQWTLDPSTRYGLGPIDILWQGSTIARLRRVGAKPAFAPGGCKTCGSPGKFIRTALVCEFHGFIGGF